MNSSVKKKEYFKINKCKLSNIIKNKNDIDKIFDCVTRVHKITTKTYFLNYIWVIDMFNQIKDQSSEFLNPLPNLITERTLFAAQNSIIKKTCGPPPKKETLNMINIFNDYRLKLDNCYQEDGLHLSSILQYQAIEMITAIENNIKIHFFDYIWRFLKVSFNYSSSTDKKKLSNELKKIKNDIINNNVNVNQLTCDQKYHDWLNKNRYFIVPKEFEKNYNYDILLNPQKYLSNMIWMNNFIEGKDSKLFQVCPLRTDIIPKYINIDTKSVIEIFINSGKDLFLSNITKYQDIVWSDYFNIDFKFRKCYYFSNSISTDGLICSIRYVQKDKLVKEIIKKVKMTEGRNKQNEESKNEEKVISEKKKKKMEEKEKKIEEKNKKVISEEEKKKNEEKEKEKIKRKKKKDEEKEKEYKEQIKNFEERIEKIKKEREETEKEEIQKSKNKIKIEEKKEKRDENEFKYISEYEDIENIKNPVFCDPGKRSLFYFMNENCKILDYTNKMRMHDTNRLKYSKKLEREREKLGILKEERKLSDFVSKTNCLEKFILYADKKLEINEKLLPLYSKDIFRKYRWYSYISSRSAEDKMVNKIKKMYGSDDLEPTIILGDASIGVAMRNFISTPNKKLKKVLNKNFQVLLIDEFRTSCIIHKTSKLKEGNLSYKDKKGDSRKLHSVLTYKMENKRLGCINRDLNSCKNIEKLFNHYKIFKNGLEEEERPIIYKRGMDLS